MRRYKGKESLAYHAKRVGFLFNPETLKGMSNGFSIKNVNWKDKGEVLNFMKKEDSPLSSQFAMFNASDDLKNDFEVVSAAIKLEPLSISYASDRLKAHKEIVEQAVLSEPITLEYVDAAWRDDKELVMQAVILSRGSAFKYASPRLRDDDDIVEVATEKDSHALKWASDRLKKNVNLLLYLAIDNKAVIEHAHDDLKGDKEFVLTIMHACCNHDWERELVSEKASKEIQKLCKGQNPIKALEAAIAYEKLQFTLTQKAPEPKELKRGLKI